jgi:hypothetical protein
MPTYSSKGWYIVLPFSTLYVCIVKLWFKSFGHMCTQ